MKISKAAYKKLHNIQKLLLDVQEAVQKFQDTYADKWSEHAWTNPTRHTVNLILNDVDRQLDKSAHDLETVEKKMNLAKRF